MWEWCFDSLGRGGFLGRTGGFIMMLMPILLVVLVFYLFNKNDWGKNPDKETPLEILKKRYARGDISKEEFEEKKKELQ